MNTQYSNIFSQLNYPIHFRFSTNSVLFLLSLFINQITYGQYDNRDIIEKYRIKSVVEQDYNVEYGKKYKTFLLSHKKFDSHANLIEEYNRNKSGKFKFEYDSNRLLIKKIKLSHPDSTDSRKVWNYEYNDKSLLVKEVLYSTSKHFESDSEYITKYFYNSKDQLILEQEVDGKNVYESTSYEYYDSGELYETKQEIKYGSDEIRIERFDKCGTLIYSFEHGEENPGNVRFEYLSFCQNHILDSIEIDSIYASNLGNQLYLQVILNDDFHKTIYAYDSLMNIIEISKYLYNKKEALVRSESELYDQNGRIEEFREYFQYKYCNYDKEVQTANIRRKYEYYENGLLHNIYSINIHGEIDGMTEFEIDYY